MGRVILEHVHHVVKSNEGIIDGNNLKSQNVRMSEIVNILINYVLP
jgi:hypothetical protein